MCPMILVKGRSSSPPPFHRSRRRAVLFPLYLKPSSLVDRIVLRYTACIVSSQKSAIYRLAALNRLPLNISLLCTISRGAPRQQSRAARRRNRSPAARHCEPYGFTILSIIIVDRYYSPRRGRFVTPSCSDAFHPPFFLCFFSSR